MADFGKPQNILMYLISLILEQFEETSDNIKGLLPEMLSNAGLDQVEEMTRYMTMFGTLSLYKAKKPLRKNEDADNLIMYQEKYRIGNVQAEGEHLSER